MRTKLTQENQTTITISKELKERLETFRNSFNPRYNSWDELLIFMLDYMEKAIPDDEQLTPKAQEKEIVKLKKVKLD